MPQDVRARGGGGVQGGLLPLNAQGGESMVWECREISHSPAPSLQRCPAGAEASRQAPRQSTRQYMKYGVTFHSAPTDTCWSTVLTGSIERVGAGGGGRGQRGGKGSVGTGGRDAEGEGGSPPLMMCGLWVQRWLFGGPWDEGRKGDAMRATEKARVFGYWHCLSRPDHFPSRAPALPLGFICPGLPHPPLRQD